MATPTSQDSQEYQVLPGSSDGQVVHRADRRLPPREIPGAASSYRTSRETTATPDLSGLKPREVARTADAILLLLLLNLSVWVVDLWFVIGLR